MDAVEEAAEALEVRVALVAVVGAGMQVDAVAVDLPDFDDGIANRPAVGVQDPAAQVRDFADGRRDRVVDDEQVVVGVERQLVGVERPFGLLRRPG